MSIILWGLGVALQAVILLRAIRTGMLKRYPYFYLYISCVLVESLFLYTVFGLYAVFQT